VIELLTAAVLALTGQTYRISCNLAPGPYDAYILLEPRRVLFTWRTCIAATRTHEPWAIGIVAHEAGHAVVGLDEGAAQCFAFRWAYRTSLLLGAPRPRATARAARRLLLSIGPGTYALPPDCPRRRPYLLPR